MKATFAVTEDNLTNAIFNNSSLDASGSGTKDEARAMAKILLAGEDLLDAVQRLLPFMALVKTERQYGDDLARCWDETVAFAQSVVDAALTDSGPGLSCSRTANAYCRPLA